MNTADAMMFGRGRRRESGTENNRDGKRSFYLAEHFHISGLSFATSAEIGWW
jgi:hypothetical protein